MAELQLVAPPASEHMQLRFSQHLYSPAVTLTTSKMVGTWVWSQRLFSASCAASLMAVMLPAARTMQIREATHMPALPENLGALEAL